MSDHHDLVDTDGGGVAEPDLIGPLPEVRTALEAVLLVVDEPVAEVVLAQVVERPTEEVGRLLHELAAEYDVSNLDALLDDVYSKAGK